ncbi:MAG: hypothetical protein E7321_04050 [Clostridiales bacterium]|nr:hypothetical protein [Clostridiales bacterium]
MNKILRGAAVLLACVVLCIASNFLAFAIDTPDMRQNAWQGCLMLGEQQSQPQTVGGFLSGQLDNYTAVLILKTAGYIGGESLPEKAVGGYRVDMPAMDGQSSWDAYCNYEFGELAPAGSLISYSRYWHGYTLPLRALLCVLDMANIQMILYFVQLALMIAVLYLMNRRGLCALIPGFFLSYFLMMPFSASICLQYMPVSMLMLIACALILGADERIERAVTLPVFFAALGLFTNYFDLLTFPLVSLGFPLILLLALRMRRGECCCSLFGLTALCGVSWALGYGLMWALKWVLTACVFGPGVLGNIFVQIGLRTSDNAGSISRFTVLMENLNIFLAKKSYLLLIGLCGLCTLAPAARVIAQKRSLTLDMRAAMLLLPGLAACLWLLVTANHAHDHTYFTYRNTTVMIFSVFAFIAFVLAPKQGDCACRAALREDHRR